MAEIVIENYAFGARIFYNIVQDIPANRSTLHITGLDMRTLTGATLGGCWISGTIRIGGQMAVELVLTNTQFCGAILGAEYDGGTEDSWNGFFSNDVTIDHRADGSGELRVQVDLTVLLSGSALEIDPGLHAAATSALPRIPRVTEAAAETGELGQELVIRLSRASDRFRDTLRWQCGTHSGTIAEKTGLTQLTWTPPRQLADAAPEDVTVPITITVESFDGETAIGTGQLLALCRIPEDIVPTGVLTVTDRLGYAAEFGGFIQSQSRLRVQTQAAGAYGASIRRIAVTCGGLTGEGEDVTFLPETSGSLTVAVTVTDSRGRQCALQETVAVLPYAKPEIAIREAYRCSASGEPQPDGSWMKLVFDARVDGERASYRALWALHGQTQETVLAMPGYENHCQIHGGSVVLAAGADNGYDCRIAVTDRFQTVYSLPVWVSVAFVLLDLSRDTRAVGIGMRARGNSTLSIGMDADLTEHRLTNLADPVNAQDAVTKAYLEARLAALID